MRRSYKDLLLTTGFFCCVFLALVYFGRVQVFSDFHPAGDIAADILLENKIDREGVLLTGHYSRYRFNHPGPFFFYFHHVAHSLLDWTSLAITDIWAVSTVFINTFFIVLSAALASKLLDGKIRLLPVAVFTLISISIIQTKLFANWMPYKLVAPYMAFFITSILIAGRRYRYLPLGVALGSILIHGYVTLILFTLPVLAASFFYGYTTHKGKIEPRERKYILYGMGIGAIFASPILLDLLIADESNLARIVDAFFEQSAGRSVFPTDALTIQFASRILFENLTVLHFAIVAISANIYYLRSAKQNEQRSERREDETGKIIAFLFLVITSLFILYYQMAPRPLHEMMGQFYWALSVSLLSMAGAHVFASGRVLPDVGIVGRSLRVGPLGCLILTLFLIATMKSPEPIKPSSSYLVDLARSIRSATSEDGHAYIAYEDHSMWQMMAGLLLELDNQSYDSCTTSKAMGYLYTDRKICDSEKAANIAVVKTGRCGGNCIGIAGKYGLIKGNPDELAEVSDRRYPGRRERMFGRGLIGKGDLEGAIAMFERALANAPDDPMAYHDLAVAASSAGDPDRGLALIEKGLDIDPHNGFLLRSHGNVLRSQGRLDEAIEQHRLALRALPEADSHNALGASLLAAGQTKRAANHFRRALVITPNHASARQNLILAEQALRDIDHESAR